MRVVRVESVQTPPWSTQAIGWGHDVDDGYHVAFALPRERAKHLQAELESEGEAFYKVFDAELLFANRPGEGGTPPLP